MSDTFSILRKIGLCPALAVKQSAAGSLIAIHGQGAPVWTPRNYGELAHEGFARNAIAYRCVRMISETAAAVPWVLYENARGRERELDTHPLLSLLARPNPLQSGAEFKEAWFGFLQIAGNAYIEAADVRGVVRELYVLRPDRMKVIPGARGWPAAYEYSAGGKSVRFDMDAARGRAPILHMRLFHPSNDHYGFSPIEAAALGIDLHNAAAGWNKALLDNGARPSGALIYHGTDGNPNLSQDQLARLKQELSDNYQGPANAGRPLLLDGGLDWKEMSFNPKDMDFIQSKHVAAREIALAFGVPPMLLGIQGDNTYANYREANLAFHRQTVLPLVGKACAALNQWLGPRFDTALRLWYDADQVEALAADRDGLWKRVQEADFLTINEKRAATGYAPVADGDRLSDIWNKT
ncbi:MAG: phage portal protein [Alphaproteobacteria bacterium]